MINKTIEYIEILILVFNFFSSLIISEYIIFLEKIVFIILLIIHYSLLNIN